MVLYSIALVVVVVVVVVVDVWLSMISSQFLGVACSFIPLLGKGEASRRPNQRRNGVYEEFLAAIYT